MENKLLDYTINIIKLPFYLLFFFFLMLVSFFIPTKYIYRLYNVINIEESIHSIFSKPIYIKSFAFLLAVIMLVLYKLGGK